MQLKLGEVINFNIFYEAVKTQKLSFKTLYKLSTLAKALDEKVVFYQEQVREILGECGEHDQDGNLVYTEDGQNIKLAPEKQMECMQKLNELAAVEVELPDVKFTIEDFGDAELTFDVFQIISPFIE